MSEIRKTLILASNCFSGQDLVDLLLDDPHREIVGVGRSPEGSAAFARYRSHTGRERFRYHQLDINTDSDALLELFDHEKPDTIVNFAAQGEVGTSWEHPEQWLQTNAVAIARVVNHLRSGGYLRRFLQVSTPEVYGSIPDSATEDSPINPSTPYAAAKAAGDLMLATYAKQFGFPLLTVRATNVYGARQQLYRIIPRTLIRLRAGKKIQLHGGGRAVKSYIHIRDVSRGELDILEQGQIGECYHLSPDDAGVKIRDLVKLICDTVGVSFEQWTETVDERPGQDKAYIVNSYKARSEFGWSPAITLEAGLDEVRRWVDEYWEQLCKSDQDYVYRP